MTATIPPSHNESLSAKGAVGFPRARGLGVKPRRVGLTQIHGRFYNAAAQRRLADELETLGSCVDSLEFTGGPFSLLRPQPLAGIVSLCRRHAVAVSAGGLSERVLAQRGAATDRYLRACHDLGVDIIGLSSRVTAWLDDDWRWLVQRVQRAGLKVRPTISLKAVAADTPYGRRERDGARDVDRTILLAQEFVQAGVDLVVLASEGVTDKVPRWRTDVATRLIETLGSERVMLEVTDPDVLTWYVKHCGPSVNVFVDHDYVAFLECLRAGIWTSPPFWGDVENERRLP